MDAPNPSLDELVVVQPSPIHANGLFAARRIQKDRLIGVFEGRRTRRNGTYVLWVHGDEGVYGLSGTNVLRFANHSARPNAVFWGEELWSLRSIPAGTEITIDYGPDWA